MVDFGNIQVGHESLNLRCLVVSSLGEGCVSSTLAEHSPLPAMPLHSGLPVTWPCPLLEPSAMIKEVSQGGFQPCPAMLLGTHPFLLGKSSQLDPQQRHHFQNGLQECQREGQFLLDKLGETEEKKGQNFCNPSFLVITTCRCAGPE